jgi:hypothetical protein
MSGSDPNASETTQRPGVPLLGGVARTTYRLGDLVEGGLFPQAQRQHFPIYCAYPLQSRHHRVILGPTHHHHLRLRRRIGSAGRAAAWVFKLDSCL